MRFVHPGVLLTRPMLDQMRADIAAKVEPVSTAYHLASTSTTPAYSTMPPVQMWALNYTAHPQTILANGSGITANREDSLAAYTHALLWVIRRDPRHAEKAISIMDGWAAVSEHQPPIQLQYGLQVAWAAAVWPRAAEIMRYTYGRWPADAAFAFGSMCHRLYLPLVDKGASTNGNLGLVMSESMLNIAVYTENASVFDAAVERWRAQADAYLYLASDGTSPRRPPSQRFLDSP